MFSPKLIAKALECDEIQMCFTGPPRIPKAPLAFLSGYKSLPSRCPRFDGQIGEEDERQQWFSEWEERGCQLYLLIPSYSFAFLWIPLSCVIGVPCDGEFNLLIFTTMTVALPFLILDYKHLKGMDSVSLICLKSSVAPLQRKCDPSSFLWVTFYHCYSLYTHSFSWLSFGLVCCLPCSLGRQGGCFSEWLHVHLIR